MSAPAPSANSVKVQRVVDVEAGKNGEHVGLQEGDQELEPGERHHEAERNEAREAEGEDEAGENLEQRVPRQHVGEEPHGKTYRPREIGDDLDRNEKRPE